MATLRVSAARRITAWLVTGPVGFFVAGVIDWLSLLARYLGARVRGRRPDW